jgi:hypothetical protein
MGRQQSEWFRVICRCISCETLYDVTSNVLDNVITHSIIGKPLLLLLVLFNNNMSQSQPSEVSKDLEGIPDAFAPVEDAPKPSGERQRKIAVLTSGGDSAGMNAAGMSHIFHH